jgi:antitoxin component YwqK of YwqJK toxin-antitoxin module
MKNTICFFLLFVAATTVSAQTDTITFFVDGMEKKTEPYVATYFRMGIKETPYWKVYDFYLSNEKVRMSAYFLDDSLTIKHGPCIYYSKTGRMIEKSTYDHGKTVGIKKGWYESGKLKDSGMYSNGVLIGDEFGWFEDGSIRTIKKFDTSGTGNGHYVNYYSNRAVRDSGTYSNNKRNGTWYFYRADKTAASEVLFSSDSVMAYKAFDAKGKLSNTREFEREAVFKGGEKGWNNYVSGMLTSLYTRSDASIYNGTCEVLFIVNEDGSVSDVEAVSYTNEALFNFIAKMLLQSKKWEPAIQYNLPVRAWRKQRFTIRPTQ